MLRSLVGSEMCIRDRYNLNEKRQQRRSDEDFTFRTHSRAIDNLAEVVQETPRGGVEEQVFANAVLSRQPFRATAATTATTAIAIASIFTVLLFSSNATGIFSGVFGHDPRAVRHACHGFAEKEEVVVLVVQRDADEETGEPQDRVEVHFYRRFRQRVVLR